MEAKLKSDIHEIIDRIQNDELLHTLYDFLKVRENNTPGLLWKSLSDEQKHEVFLSFQESENEDNLISRNDLFNNS